MVEHGDGVITACHAYNQQVIVANSICAEPISVKTSIGTIRGRVVDAPQGGSSVAEYLGIPFARPPLGELRYADPVPLDTLPSGTSQLQYCLVIFRVNLNENTKLKQRKIESRFYAR